MYEMPSTKRIKNTSTIGRKTTVHGGLASLRSNRGVLESLNIRKEFFPVATTAATSLLLFISVGVLFGLMPFFDYVPPWTVVFLPIVLVFLILLVLGISYILSIVHIYVPDIQPFWGILVHTLFFLSPIFWYLNDVNDFLLAVHAFNPVGQLIELSHKLIVFGQVPPLTEWAHAFVFVFGFFIVGYAIFQKFEAKTVEEL